MDDPLKAPGLELNSGFWNFCDHILTIICVTTDKKPEEAASESTKRSGWGRPGGSFFCLGDVFRRVTNKPVLKCATEFCSSRHVAKKCSSPKCFHCKKCFSQRSHAVTLKLGCFCNQRLAPHLLPQIWSLFWPGLPGSPFITQPC